jgi:hypothetical protein
LLIEAATKFGKEAMTVKYAKKQNKGRDVGAGDCSNDEYLKYAEIAIRVRTW